MLHCRGVAFSHSSVLRRCFTFPVLTAIVYRGFYQHTLGGFNHVRRVLWRLRTFESGAPWDPHPPR